MNAPEPDFKLQTVLLQPLSSFARFRWRQFRDWRDQRDGSHGI